MVLLAALALLGTAYIGVFVSGFPTVLCPFPALTVIPVFILSQWNLEYAAVLIPALLFLAWNPQLIRGEGKIPKRSLILLVLLVVLTAVDLVGDWNGGIKYHGSRYTAVVCSINILWVGFLALGFHRTVIKTPTFRTSLFLHWVLFAWVSWYAFPWLGELP